MARDYSTNELVAKVKLRIALPTNQATFTAERICSILDDEMQATVVPFVLGVGGEHLLRWSDVTLTDEVEYDVPSLAAGDRIRDAAIVDPTTGEHLNDVAVLSIDTLHTGRGTEPAIVVRGNKLIVYPRSRAGETLRLYYHRRPNRLVWTTRAVQVTAVDVGLSTLTVSGTIPSGWTSGTVLSVVPSVPPFDERDQRPTVVSAATPTLELDSVDGVEVGDWVALEGESAVPQLPADLHIALVAVGSWRILSALASPRAEDQFAEWERLSASWASMAAPRVEGEPRLVVGADTLVDALGDG